MQFDIGQLVLAIRQSLIKATDFPLKRPISIIKPGLTSLAASSALIIFSW
jgi:hypothetical protein